MGKFEVMIPALDYLLDNPGFLTPETEQNGTQDGIWLADKIYIPEEYLSCLARESSRYPQDSYDLVARRLIDFAERQTRETGTFLSNGVWVELKATCASREETEQTEAMYLPFKLCDRLNDHGIAKKDLVILAGRREVQLLATYNEVPCWYFPPAQVRPVKTSDTKAQPSDFDMKRLTQQYLVLPDVDWEQEVTARWLNDGGILTLVTQGELAQAVGKRGYVGLNLPGKEQPLLVRYYDADQECELPEYLQTLRHNLPDKLLEKLPGAQWQKALSDAILLPPEDANVVICAGPANTGKTLTALATVIEGVPARFSTPADQRRRKIVFPYRLFRAEDYRQGYEWAEGLPLAPDSPDRGWDYSPDLRRMAFTNWLTDAWNELAYLKDREESAGLIKFLSARCDFCPFESLIHRHVSDAYIFLDDFQNYTESEARQLLSTVGRNSKLIILGDIERVTRPGCTAEDNGLSYVMMELVAKQPRVAYVRLLPENRPLGIAEPLL